MSVMIPLPFVGRRPSESLGSISIVAMTPRPVGPVAGFPVALHENTIWPTSG
jgi:hypothetical protein